MTRWVTILVVVLGGWGARELLLRHRSAAPVRTAQAPPAAESWTPADRASLEESLSPGITGYAAPEQRRILDCMVAETVRAFPGGPRAAEDLERRDRAAMEALGQRIARACRDAPP